MATKAAKSIVYCPNYNGHEALFMMAHDDFRFGTEGYTTVTGGRYVHKERAFHGDDGRTYEVFPDWSVRRVASTVPALTN